MNGTYCWRRDSTPPAALLLAVLTMFAAGAAAQDAVDPDSPDFRPADHGLAADLFTNEHIGLRMFYPAGAAVTPMNYAGQGLIIVIQDDDSTPTWQMRIQQMVLRRLPDPSAKAVADQLMREIARGGGEDVEILRNQPRYVGGRPAHELWARQQDVIAGFLIAETGTERYTVFRIATTAERYERLRPIFDATLSTVRLSTDVEVRARRDAEFSRAEEVIQTLTPERLKSLLGMAQWYRIYQKHESGDWRRDKEIGYVRLTIEEGMRGQVNPERNPADFKAVESEKGMLVIVAARYLESEAGPGAPPIFADFEIRLWLAWDRSQEVWLSRATYRQGDASRHESESGTREAPSLAVSKLNVVKRDRVLSWVVHEPYLSQPEVYLLGHLLPRDGSITGTMRFHAFETTHESLEALPARVDTWSPARDGSGNWVLESSPSPDLPGVTSIFDRNGRLIRREKAGNVFTEPMERQRILEIWRAKGLPTSGE